MSLFVVKANNLFWKYSLASHGMLVLLYLLVSLSDVSCEPCMATAFAGTFRGVLSQSRSVLTPNFSYCSFRGMPYAKPPKGPLRFARPVSAAPLGGNVYNATADGNKCPQFNAATLSAEGDEDCLFLNVYAPQIQDPKQLLPVMVFIHGSGFLGGSSDSQFYGPDNLVPKNVVLVTFNYRLNLFGFLNLKTSQCSGNMGLADQIMACRWVQKNIQSFGGDPNRVTLFGESAGGHSTYLLALSPQARGLFHKVIIESTIFTTDSYLARDADSVVNSSIQLARIVGYLGDARNHEAILRYLLTLPAKTLVVAYFTLILILLKTDFDGYYHAHGAPLFPCIDYYVKDGIIPTNFEELGKSVPSTIPFLIGLLNADGSIYLGLERDMVSYTKSHLDIYLREADPIFVKDKPTQEKVIQEVIARYYNASNNDNEVDKSVKLLTFLSYYNLYKQISHLRAPYLSGNVRIFEFSFASGPYDVLFKQASFPQYASLVKGAAHGEEILYLFYLSQLSAVTPNNDERKIINQMTTWWTNFAKTGNPNSRSDDIAVEWEPSTPAQNRYLEINNETRLVNTKINQEDYDFFARLERFAKYYQAGRKTKTGGSQPVNTSPNGGGYCQQIPSINYGQFVPAAGVWALPN